MKQLLIIILLSISVAGFSQGNWTLSGAKNRWGNGIGFSTKDTATYTNGSDSVLLVVGLDGQLHFKYKTFWNTLSSTGATFNLGTTALALNRSSAAVALTGITSIDGSAATLTTARTIQGVSFNGSANINILSGSGFVQMSGTTISYVPTISAANGGTGYTSTTGLAGDAAFTGKYLALTGGTLTGTLNGTSFSASANITAGTGLSGSLTSTMNSISIGTSQYQAFTTQLKDDYLKIKLYDGGSTNTRAGFGYGYDAQSNLGGINYYAPISHAFLTGGINMFQIGGSGHFALNQAFVPVLGYGGGTGPAFVISDQYTSYQYGQIFSSASGEFSLGYNSLPDATGTKILSWNKTGAVTTNGGSFTAGAASFTTGAFSGNLFVNNSTTTGVYFLDGAQTGHHKYSWYNGITAVSNTGMSFRDETGGIDLLSFNSSYNANFYGSVTGGAASFTTGTFSGSITGQGANQYFGTNGQDNTINLYGYNSSTSLISSNAGVSSTYNGVRIVSNSNNANSLPAWSIDLGGNTNTTTISDAFTVGRKSSGGSWVTALTINSSQQATFAGAIIANSTIRMQSYTVATLPTGVTGSWAYVTDALAPTYGATVVGGGAIVTPVFYNGSNWTCR